MTDSFHQRLAEWYHIEDDKCGFVFVAEKTEFWEAIKFHFDIDQHKIAIAEGQLTIQLT